MITFNDILRREGIEVAQVKLVRHQDNRGESRGATPYQLWRNDQPSFERYQSIQGRLVFDQAQHIAAFVATPRNDTLFAGLYAIAGVSTAPKGLIDPVTSKDVGGLHLYDLKRVDKLSEYVGRLSIDWGKGFRVWVQSAGKNNKPVTKLLAAEEEPPFPGFLDFEGRLSELPTVPVSWIEALSSVSGIYLLIHPETGKQYVGAAYGAHGFWGRWTEYAASGHGGNMRLQELPPADYHVRVLEVVAAASGSLVAEDLFLAESRWKRKLLSRDSEFGLNAN